MVLTLPLHHLSLPKTSTGYTAILFWHYCIWGPLYWQWWCYYWRYPDGTVIGWTIVILACYYLWTVWQHDLFVQYSVAVLFSVLYGSISYVYSMVALSKYTGNHIYSMYNCLFTRPMIVSIKCMCILFFYFIHFYRFYYITIDNTLSYNSLFYTKKEEEKIAYILFITSQRL